MHSGVSVSIVLYKTSLRQLQRCLESLKQLRLPIKLWLIDNSPCDRLRVAESFFPDSIYKHLPENPGFGKGHNVAIREAQIGDFKYHLILNADVYFNNDILAPMINYMEVQSNVGQMMPKVLNPDGSIQRLCKLVPSPLDMFFRRFLISKVKERKNRKFELHFSGYNQIMFVPYLSGCFMLLRHRVLKKVGLFDERFFMYPEDIDLTRRIAEKYETIFFQK